MEIMSSSRGIYKDDELFVDSRKEKWNADPDMITSPQGEQQQLTVSLSFQCCYGSAGGSVCEGERDFYSSVLRGSDRAFAPVCDRQRGLLRAILANKDKWEYKASSLATYVAKMGQVILDV